MSKSKSKNLFDNMKFNKKEEDSEGLKVRKKDKYKRKEKYKPNYHLSE